MRPLTVLAHTVVRGWRLGLGTAWVIGRSDLESGSFLECECGMCLERYRMWVARQAGDDLSVDAKAVDAMGERQ